MDSELQAALVWVDSDPFVVEERYIIVLAKAARKVANLDIEAAAQKLAQIHGTTVDNDPWYRPEALMVVDAALGVTEAPDGQ